MNTDIKAMILYEDKSLIVLHKPAGMAVESARVTQPDLVSLLRAYLRAEVYPVHRLDQVVEGAVVFAKTKSAAAQLSRQVQDGSMRKIYRARVCGKVPAESGTLSDELIRDKGSNLTRVVPAGTDPRAKKAVLRYRRLSDNEVEIELVTGRFHQIRAQLAHAGMPVEGDVKYGAPADTRQRGKIALVASELTFRHPVTGRQMTFSVGDAGVGSGKGDNGDSPFCHPER